MRKAQSTLPIVFVALLVMASGFFITTNWPHQEEIEEEMDVEVVVENEDAQIEQDEAMDPNVPYTEQTGTDSLEKELDELSEIKLEGTDSDLDTSSIDDITL
jgi:hypothetical protein